MQSLNLYTIYEIYSPTQPLHGVMFRGRIRKLCIEKNINVLVENAEDKDNVVRFAVLDPRDAIDITDYVMSITPDAEISLCLERVPNPILSKLKK
ncbi:MAG: hypothetical protein LRY46_00905 [Candidatus Pacebacteria bacterium]|nr:hypothetical protein [Candidatus Paceibacterota bacterium]